MCETTSLSSCLLALSSLQFLPRLKEQFSITPQTRTHRFLCFLKSIFCMCANDLLLFPSYNEGCQRKWSPVLNVTTLCDSEVYNRLQRGSRTTSENNQLLLLYTSTCHCMRSFCCLPVCQVFHRKYTFFNWIHPIAGSQSLFFNLSHIEEGFNNCKWVKQVKETWALFNRLFVSAVNKPLPTSASGLTLWIQTNTPCSCLYTL